tara:strand:- start:37 stop:654 length:618 start_codon:yes stop_codon:yes gene_type:complete
MKSLVLIGGGGHCRSCVDVIESEGRFKIAGIIDNNVHKTSPNLGIPTLGTDNDLPYILEKYQHAMITIGQIKSANKRKELYDVISNLKINLPIITAKSSVVSRHSIIGDGSIIMHGAVVNAGASIGRNAIINNMALIEHDVSIGDHCHISTGVKINGGVKIGEESFIGSGTIVHHGVTIGNNVVISAGTVISKDVSDGKTIGESK